MEFFVIAFCTLLLIGGILMAPVGKTIKISQINSGTQKVYCLKDDKDGLYKRGDIGYTISDVVDGRVFVSFSKIKSVWVPIEYVNIIYEEKNN